MTLLMPFEHCPVYFLHPPYLTDPFRWCVLSIFASFHLDHILFVYALSVSLPLSRNQSNFEIYLDKVHCMIYFDPGYQNVYIAIYVLPMKVADYGRVVVSLIITSWHFYKGYIRLMVPRIILVTYSQKKL